ncbi:ABC transporter ATP-binding protein [Mesorhizobium sp. RP14(2022)]|uniref:ABC transporter ATP-binding protein n=1 Tax=Mesorhizobium liriopis TaxID=2953882 RepID=A0ABT1C440_9HYPH|nr:ABC transporter ATP-binding protein [Mesorhizobium liriopis]MCO6049601.1 ABC transporter ATP-binding protein [Mesorhizobium liriopis]
MPAAFPSSSDTAPILEARGLVRAFGGLRAVDGMSLVLGRGEMVGLIGPNGAGKTTFFNLLAGSLVPDSGAIMLGNRDIARERPEKRIGAGLGRTFQIPKPFREMTVLENVLTGAQGQSGEGILANFLSPSRVRVEEHRAAERARELLDFVRLSHLTHEPAAVLSGGQRKLLELARVLMADPSVLLLDEPAAGVNPALLELIIDRVRLLNAQGRTVLLIEHNMDMVSRLCERVVVMAEGSLLAEGAPAQVLARKDVAEAYLGQVAA